jgi:hypothetical protein
MLHFLSLMILNVELLFLMISMKNKLRIMLENSKAFRQKRFGNIFGLIVFFSPGMSSKSLPLCNRTADFNLPPSPVREGTFDGGI